jgi:hypothetical protein
MERFAIKLAKGGLDIVAGTVVDETGNILHCEREREG